MDKLVAQAKRNKDKELKGTDRMGVRCKTLLRSAIVTCPGLHWLLGIGNQLRRYIFDRIDFDIEPLGADELLLRVSGP